MSFTVLANCNVPALKRNTIWTEMENDNELTKKKRKKYYIFLDTFQEYPNKL